MNILHIHNLYTEQEIRDLADMYRDLDKEDDREKLAQGCRNIGNYTGSGAVGLVGAKGVRGVLHLDEEPIMQEPLDTMPLHINDENVLIKAIAQWRLKMGR